MNSLQLTPFRLNIAGLTCTDSDTNRIEIFHNLFAGNIFAYFASSFKNHTFLFEQRHTTVNHIFIEFEVRNAVT